MYLIRISSHFFSTYTSETEMSLCLCKLCLNAKQLFEPLMLKARKDGDEAYESVLKALMTGCSCPKSNNDFTDGSVANAINAKQLNLHPYLV